MIKCQRCSGMHEKEADCPIIDNVNHPAHYQGNGMQAIDVIESFGLGFNLGCAVKYLLRAGRKGDAKEDLRKALWYIERQIHKPENDTESADKSSPEAN